MAKKRQPRWKSPTSSSQKTLIWVLVLFLVGSLALRIVLAHQVDYPQVDGTYYLDQARELVGRGYLDKGRIGIIIAAG